MFFKEKEISAAIFDMDGTMFDTERLRFKMLKAASKELYNTEISDEVLYDSLGVSAVTGEKIAKSVYGSDYPYKEIRKRADELEREYIRNNGVPVKDGIYNIFERLKRSGVFIALATSSRREIAEEYLLHAKVLRYFDVLVCGDEVEKGKPAPDIFIKAAKELNCDCGECLIFEDSQNGLIAASESGGLPIFIRDIKEPEPDVKKLAFASYERTRGFLEDLYLYTPKMPVPQVNEQFPLNEESIAAGIHGFGAIGGGYLSQIFSHWDGYTRPRLIIGATPNPLVRSLVNSLGKYRVKYESLAYFQTISNVMLIDTANERDMIDMYRNSYIIGLALPEQAIKSQSAVIAKGIAARYENGGGDLTILIVMNKINSARFVRNHVYSAMKSLFGEDTAKQYTERTYFCETVVNRMVSNFPEQDILRKLHKDLYQVRKSVSDCADDIGKIVDFSKAFLPKGKWSEKTKTISISDTLASLSQFANAVSEVEITLFSSEPDMPIYASSESPVVNRLRQVVAVRDIKVMQEIKNKLSNGTHAVIAWYSAILGYKTIGQGMGDQRVLSLAEHIMIREIKPALLAENPEYEGYINSFISSFIKRCRVSFKDKCTRVARDPMRKLQNGERVIGAIQMAHRHGINAGGLEFGAACAILYSVRGISSGNAEAEKIRTLYEKNKSVVDVLTYDGEYNKSTYNGLDMEKDGALIDRIQKYFDGLYGVVNKL